METFIERLAQKSVAAGAEAQAKAAECQHEGVRSLVCPHIEALTPYQPGRPPEVLMQELGLKRFINLASNENPFGPPSSSLKAIKAAQGELSRYPESSGLKLRQALADKYKLWMENVAIGSGSESIMANIVRAFLHGDDEALTSAGTFIGFPVLIKAHGVNLRTVPLRNYRFDLEGIADAINHRTKIVYLCNPNNPTGTIFTKSEFENFMTKVPDRVLVIMDEAYHEFAGGAEEFPDSLHYRYDNLLTLRTFSKAYGLAGLRVGYGFGHDYLIGFINKIKLPFEPNHLAQVAATAALNDDKYLRRSIDNNRQGMKLLVEEFDRRGLEHVTSHANFVLVETGSEEKVQAIHQNLLRHGVAIRPLKAFGLPTCFRVTIGLPDENRAFIKALRKVL